MSEQTRAIAEALSAPFEQVHKDTRGGVELEYITGEQCIRRLNEALGVDAWSFRVLQHGIHAEADEVWVLGELTATIGERTVTRQQFGSQKVKRSRATNAPLDLGFDLKGAATDALKKCAMSLGVGLYLARREAPGEPARAEVASIAPTCEACGEPLGAVRFRDGTTWTAAQLAAHGRRKHGRTLCMAHYRQANAAGRATTA